MSYPTFTTRTVLSDIWEVKEPGVIVVSFKSCSAEHSPLLVWLLATRGGVVQGSSKVLKPILKRCKCDLKWDLLWLEELHIKLPRPRYQSIRVKFKREDFRCPSWKIAYLQLLYLNNYKDQQAVLLTADLSISGSATVQVSADSDKPFKSYDRLSFVSKWVIDTVDCYFRQKVRPEHSSLNCSPIQFKSSYPWPIQARWNHFKAGRANTLFDLCSFAMRAQWYCHTPYCGPRRSQYLIDTSKSNKRPYTHWKEHNKGFLTAPCSLKSIKNWWSYSGFCEPTENSASSANRPRVGPVRPTESWAGFFNRPTSGPVKSSDQVKHTGLLSTNSPINK